MLRTAGILLMCLAAARPGPSQEAPRFRGGASLIEFTIVALDNKGNPVTDLKKEDIAITENGQDRAVADLRFDGDSVLSSRANRLAPGLLTNRPEYTPGPPKNVVAIILDTLNTPPDEHTDLRAQTLRYLTTIPPDTRLAVYQLSGRLTVLHDFTADLESLRERLAKVASGRVRSGGADASFANVFTPPGTALPSRTEAHAGMRALASAGVDQARDRRLDQTLAALESLGNQLAAIPGRKSLVWIGAATPILAFSVPTPTDPKGWLQVYDSLLRRTAQRLATQGIAVYPVEAKGLLPATLPGRPAAADPRPLLKAGRETAAMELMAEVTGGRVTRNTNDLTEGAKLAAADVRGSYTAAFYTTGDPDGKWHDVSVKALRKGVKLTYRQGYLSQEPLTEIQEWTEEQWESAIANPVGSTALRVDAWCELATGPNGPTLNARFQVPDRDLYFRRIGRERRGEVEFAIAEKSADGAYTLQKRHATVQFPEDPAREMATEAVQYSAPWQLSASASMLRLIARDRLSGRYGTIDVAVRSLPVAGQPHSAVATPPAAGDPFIERARKASLAFLETLPNYVVKQNTNREVQLRANRNWTVQDRITAEVVYEMGKETTRDVMLNGRAVSAQEIENTGTWSTGQFGGMLNAIFAVESAADFHERSGAAKVAGRQARVYDFSVKRANSLWQLSSGNRRYTAGFDGTVWLDSETARTLRFQVRARELPQDFPLDQAESSTEYGVVRIGSSDYLVPTSSIALACSRTGPAGGMPMRGQLGPPRYCARNVIQFRGYRQFGTESNISFDGK